MDIFELLFETMEEVLELPAEEMREDPEIDLIENGLIDSLSSVMLLTEMEKKVGYRLDIKKMGPADFTTPVTLAQAIERQK